MCGLPRIEGQQYRAQSVPQGKPTQIHLSRALQLNPFLGHTNCTTNRYCQQWVGIEGSTTRILGLRYEYINPTNMQPVSPYSRRYRCKYGLSDEILNTRRNGIGSIKAAWKSERRKCSRVSTYYACPLTTRADIEHISTQYW